MSKITASIKGVHGYVPDYILTNSELEKMVDTNDEWITSRTGIKERRILKGEGLGASHMMVKAVEGLLAKTNTSAADIEMVICCTSTPDLVFPATANIVATQVGAVNAFGYDIQAACSGFLYGLTTGSQFIESGRLKKVLVIGGDKMSSIIDYTDRATCIIFGDGAGAVLLEANEEGNGLMDFWLRSDGSGEPYLHMTAGGSRKPASHETVDLKEHFVYQDGKTVFKFAVTNMAYAATQVMQRNNLTGDDIAYLVPHQANKRIIDATARGVGVPDEKVLMNIEKYGNTTNGTIPLLLWDFESKFKKGDNLLIAAFGGGFTWGAAYLKWAY
ncbi:MAG: ketoacyl-ACP synthase III [Cytophagales bacterium]|nr:MAG: ketoacyl-ACP synthase III [Cytophagales bacterium]